MVDDILTDLEVIMEMVKGTETCSIKRLEQRYKKKECGNTFLDKQQLVINILPPKTVVIFIFDDKGEMLSMATATEG